MKRLLVKIAALLLTAGGACLLLGSAPHAPPTLVIGEAADPSSLSPLTARSNQDIQIMVLLFLPLTRTEPDFSRSPGLAKSWEFSEDRLELTFHLRRDVFWQDGVQVTARDVEFTHSLLVDPAVGYHSIRWKRYIEDCIAVDDFTVKFTFSKAYPDQVMDASVGSPVPKHLLEKVPRSELQICRFNQDPVGNGPFRLAKWKRGESIELVASETYCDGAPRLKRIIFKVIPDTMNQILQLRRGDIDLMIRVPPEHCEELAGQPHLVVHTLPDRVYYAIAWNLKDPLFQSRKVRHALTLAIPRADLLKRIFGDHGRLCDGPISPILWAYNPDVRRIPHDPKKAVELLEEDGWRDSDGDGIRDKDGAKFSFELIANRGNTVKETTNTIVQAKLREIGIEVTTRSLENAEYTRRLTRDKDFQAATVGWGVGLKMDMTAMWHSKSVGDPFNVVGFQSEELDRLNDEAVFELDREKARPLWWKAQEIIVEEQPYTFLYFPDQINFVNRRVRNVRMSAIGWNQNIEEWEIAEEP
ncbi:MAG: peptide-binding protein [Planctomycetes bacterium]|nr:peptide-binding protein [Planctomycetota bacterium]